MNARELYGLIVRVAGSAFIVFALFDVAYAITKGLGFPMGSTLPISTDIIGVLEWGVFGLAILVGAERIVQLVYGRRQPSSE